MIKFWEVVNPQKGQGENSKLHTERSQPVGLNPGPSSYYITVLPNSQLIKIKFFFLTNLIRKYRTKIARKSDKFTIKTQIVSNLLSTTLE